MERNIRIFIGLILIILFTQLQIEIEVMNLDLPITGQTFAVLLVAYVLGLKDGSIAILLYLLLGLFGLPVFADGGAGISSFSGNSGGYLIGFLFGGLLTAYISKSYPNKLVNSFFAAFMGTCVILIFGVAQLSFHIGFFDAIRYGLNPFILGGFVKIILGGITAYFLKKQLNNRQEIKERND